MNSLRHALGPEATWKELVLVILGAPAIGAAIGYAVDVLGLSVRM